MKSLLIFILCISFLNAIDVTFDEKRQLLLSTIHGYINAEDRSADITMKKYIKADSTKDISLYINTVNKKELSERHIPQYIYDKIMVLDFMSKPIGVVHSSFEISSRFGTYTEIYGAVMKHEDMLFYYLFDINMRIYFINGCEQVTYEECTTASSCKTKTKYVPKGVPDSDYEKLVKYIGYLSFEMIKSEYAGIQKLNGKVLYTINQDVLAYTEYFSGSSAGLLLSDGMFYIGTKCDLAEVTGVRTCDIEDRPKMIKIGTTFNKQFDFSKMTIFLTDDGNMNCVSLKYGEVVWSRKVFDPTGGELPFKFTISNDNDFITYDRNFKILGTIKNEENFKNLDFALPDKAFIMNKDYTYLYVCYGFNKCSVNIVESQSNKMLAEEWVWYYDVELKKVYQNVNIGHTGYTVVTKQGVIQHIQFEKETTIDWEIKPNVLGSGPYRIIVTEDGEIQAINGEGQIYWSSLDLMTKKVYYKK